MRPLLIPSEAAAVLGISITTLLRRARRGVIPGALKLFGTRWRFIEKPLLKYKRLGQRA